MKNLIKITALITILFFSACTSGKINYRIDDQGRMVVDKTVPNEFAIRGNASDASSEAVEYEKNMTIKVMYNRYLSLLEKGNYENAKKLRVEIEILKGKITSTPDTPIYTTSPPPKTITEDPNEDPQTKMKRIAKRKIKK